MADAITESYFVKLIVDIANSFSKLEFFKEQIVQNSSG